MIVSSGVKTAFADAIYSFTTIDYPGAAVTRASGVNATGQIVGSFDDTSGLTHGFLDIGGRFVQLDHPGTRCSSLPCGTSAGGINDSGQIVGGFHDQIGSHGFLYSGGSFSTIDFPGAVGQTTASGINDTGQIVGGFALSIFVGGCFLYSGGSFTAINVPHAEGCGINNSGQIVGDFYDGGPNRGFLYSGGSFTTIAVPGASYTFARGINDAGEIVGSYFDAAMNLYGFLEKGGSFTTINVPGAQFTAASGINDGGEITGTFQDASGVHGFVATPVPEPGSLTLTAPAVFLMGLFALARRRGIGMTQRKPIVPAPTSVRPAMVLASTNIQPRKLRLGAVAIFNLIGIGSENPE